MQNDIVEERDENAVEGYGSGYNSDRTLSYDDRIQIEEEKK
jgi:hypothetical protein